MVKSLIGQGIQKIKNELANMPNKPGVYRMLDKNEKVLYVGKAKDLSKRIVNYTQINRLCQRMRLAIEQIDRLEIITVHTEAQALVLEANLIKSLKPKYNILLKDDKSMPYILVRQNHQYSQIQKFRGSKDVKGEYFGPFASVKTVDDTIEFLEKSFLLRNCSDHFFSTRKTPCMQYQIKRCSAPCVNKISLKDYQYNVNQALTFLKGKSIKLQQEISAAMQKASGDMEYEKAAKYRDQLRALNYIQNKNMNLFNIEEADVIGVAKEGDIACIQLFLFRNNQNYGNRSFFFSQVLDEPIERILEIFLTQYYQYNSIPKVTISSILPEEYQAFSEGFAIKLLVPKSGDNLKVLNFAEENAKMALNRKYEEKQQKQDLVRQVQELFAIEEPIKRIEIYDNSHIMGAHAVGAMVVATDEGFNKKQYRKFNIKTATLQQASLLNEHITRHPRQVSKRLGPGIGCVLNVDPRTTLRSAEDDESAGVNPVVTTLCSAEDDERMRCSRSIKSSSSSELSLLPPSSSSELSLSPPSSSSELSLLPPSSSSELSLSPPSSSSELSLSPPSSSSELSFSLASGDPYLNHSRPCVLKHTIHREYSQDSRSPAPSAFSSRMTQEVVLGDDYAMLKEVLSRRFAKLEPDNYPDLLLIDGGAGHLSAAKSVMEKFNLNIPLVCISKGVERNAGKELFHQINKEPFTLDKHLPVMKYLQILRDEAHRFAITSHRQKRTQAMNFSYLKQIPGIGPIRRKMLINHFASLEDIKNATLEQLLKIEGINKKTAEAIFLYFHS